MRTHVGGAREYYSTRVFENLLLCMLREFPPVTLGYFLGLKQFIEEVKTSYRGLFWRGYTGLVATPTLFKAAESCQKFKVLCVLVDQILKFYQQV